MLPGNVLKISRPEHSDLHVYLYIRTGEGTREQCRSTCIIRTGVSYVHTSVHTSSEACIQNKNTVYYAYTCTVYTLIYMFYT